MIYKKTGERTKKVYLRRLTMLLLLPGLWFGQYSLAAPQQVTVQFNGVCPVVPQQVAVVTLLKNGVDKVQWIAVNTADDKPVTTGYAIFFDPFRGKPMTDHDKDGVIDSTPVANDVPVGVEFKYTIVGDGCTGPALDPRIVVR